MFKPIFFYVFLVSLTLFSFVVNPSYAAGTTETSGDILRVIIPAAAYGSTFVHDDAAGRRQFYISFLSSVAATQVLKLAISRERPDASDDDSFPSGHTADAFQGATFLQSRYGLKYGIPAYIGASFVGYSRVLSDKHHLTDVLAGALIGVASNYFTTKYQTVIVSPLTEQDGYGLKISATW